MCPTGPDPGVAPQDLFIGHPVTCDRDELVIHVVQTGDAVWRVELHNPSVQPIAATCRTDSHWTLFRFDKKVTVPAGASVTFDVHGVKP